MIQRSNQSATARQQIVQPDDGRLVKLVEVEPVPHRARERAQLLRQRVLGRFGIQRVGGGESHDHGQQADRRRQRRVDERPDQLLAERNGMLAVLGGNCLP